MGIHTFWPARVFIHEARKVIHVLADDDPEITSSIVLGDFVLRERRLRNRGSHHVMRSK